MGVAADPEKLEAYVQGVHHSFTQNFNELRNNTQTIIQLNDEFRIGLDDIIASIRGGNIPDAIRKVQSAINLKTRQKEISQIDRNLLAEIENIEKHELTKIKRISKKRMAAIMAHGR